MFNERARFRLHHPIRLVPLLQEAPVGEPRPDLARRLIDVYSDAPDRADAGPVWERLVRDDQRGLAAALNAGDAAAVALDLAAFGRSAAAQGFFGGARQHARCAADPDFAAMLAAWTYDKLVSLAEAVGAIRLELPENGDWARNVEMPVESLFARIEQKLDLDLSPPAHIGGYLGLKIGHCTIQMRIIESIYGAWRLRQIATARGLSRICEIGAGAGLTAYYAALMGIEDYVIIDLPTMNAVQAYVLAGSRIGARVALAGESADRAAIRILPNTAFAGLAQGSIDILYNQDSLPEIEVGAARTYIADARRIGIPILLSINQEAHLETEAGHQRSVPELIADVGGYRLLSRHRHWLRQGYAEEMYEATSPKEK